MKAFHRIGCSSHVPCLLCLTWATCVMPSVRISALWTCPLPLVVSPTPPAPHMPCPVPLPLHSGFLQLCYAIATLLLIWSQHHSPHLPHAGATVFLGMTPCIFPASFHTPCHLFSCYLPPFCIVATLPHADAATTICDKFCLRGVVKWELNMNLLNFIQPTALL